VNSTVSLVLRIVREYAADRVRHGTESTSGSSIAGRKLHSSGLAVASNPDADTIVFEVFSLTAVKDILKFSFAALDKLTLYAPTICAEVNNTGKLSILNTDNYYAYVCDEGCEFEDMALHVDVYNFSKVLYPLLVPVSDDLLLSDEFVALTRKSLTMSDKKYFFLDAGTEFMLYRTALNTSNHATVGAASSVSGVGMTPLVPPPPEAAAASSTLAFSSSGASVSFPQMLQLTSMNPHLADSCIHAAARARAEYPFSPTPAAVAGSGGGDGDAEQTDDSGGSVVELDGRRLVGSRQRHGVGSVSAAGESDRGSRRDKGRDGTKSTASLPTVPAVVNVMYDPKCLPGYLLRRIQAADIVPRVQVCDAGTASASLFATHLLEDHSRSGLVYDQFVEFILEIVKRTV
jgi:hypothetical protein